MPDVEFQHGFAKVLRGPSNKSDTAWIRVNSIVAVEPDRSNNALEISTPNGRYYVLKTPQAQFDYEVFCLMRDIANQS